MNGPKPDLSYAAFQRSQGGGPDLSYEAFKNANPSGAKKVARRVVKSTKGAAEQVADAVMHPLSTIGHMAKSIYDDATISMAGIPSPGARPTTTMAEARAEMIAGGMTPERIREATINTGINLGAAAVPGAIMARVAGRAAVGGALGAYYDPEDRLRGTIVGATLGEAFHQGARGVGAAASAAKRRIKGKQPPGSPVAGNLAADVPPGGWEVWENTPADGDWSKYDAWLAEKHGDPVNPTADAASPVAGPVAQAPKVFRPAPAGPIQIRTPEPPGLNRAARRALLQAGLLEPTAAPVPPTPPPPPGGPLKVFRPAPPPPVRPPLMMKGGVEWTADKPPLAAVAPEALAPETVTPPADIPAPAVAAPDLSFEKFTQEKVAKAAAAETPLAKAVEASAPKAKAKAKAEGPLREKDKNRMDWLRRRSRNGTDNEGRHLPMTEPGRVPNGLSAVEEAELAALTSRAQEHGGWQKDLPPGVEEEPHLNYTHYRWRNPPREPEALDFLRQRMDDLNGSFGEERRYTYGARESFDPSKPQPGHPIQGADRAEAAALLKRWQDEAKVNPPQDDLAVHDWVGADDPLRNGIERGEAIPEWDAAKDAMEVAKRRDNPAPVTEPAKKSSAPELSEEEWRKSFPKGPEDPPLSDSEVARLRDLNALDEQDKLSAVEAQEFDDLWHRQLVNRGRAQARGVIDVAHDPNAAFFQPETAPKPKTPLDLAVEASAPKAKRAPKAKAPVAEPEPAATLIDDDGLDGPAREYEAAREEQSAFQRQMLDKYGDYKFGVGRDVARDPNGVLTKGERATAERLDAELERKFEVHEANQVLVRAANKAEIKAWRKQQAEAERIAKAEKPMREPGEEAPVEKAPHPEEAPTPDAPVEEHAAPLHDGPYPEVPAIETTTYRKKTKHLGNPKWAYSTTEQLEKYHNDLMLRGEEGAGLMESGARTYVHDVGMDKPQTGFVPTNDHGRGKQKVMEVDRLMPLVEAELKGRYNAMTPEELADRPTRVDLDPDKPGLLEEKAMREWELDGEPPPPLEETNSIPGEDNFRAASGGGRPRPIKSAATAAHRPAPPAAPAAPAPVVHPAPHLPVGSAAPTNAQLGALPDAPGLTNQGRGRFNPGDMLHSLKRMFGGALDEGTKGSIRAENAAGYQKVKQAQYAVHSMSKIVGKLDRADAVRLWDAAEKWDTQAHRATAAAIDPAMPDMIDALHKTIGETTVELKALGLLDQVIDNYLGRFWQMQKGTAGTPSLFGRRPAEGSKSFAKRRSVHSFLEGVTPVAQGGRGLTPLSYNFVDAQVMKLAEMRKAIAFTKAIGTEIDLGRAKKVLVGMQPPVDQFGRPWKRIGDGTDPSFNIYGPHEITIREAFDAGVRQQLDEVIASLPKLVHERKISVGGEGRWGYAEGPVGNKMVTKFGGDATVIMHELGHILDFRYGLWDKLMDPPGNKQVVVTKPGSKNFGQTVTRTNSQKQSRIDARRIRMDEARALADMRDGVNGPQTTARSKYLRNKKEQMANAVHALIYAPELMQKVAPNLKADLTAFLQGDPLLRKVLDIKPTLELGSAEASLPVPGIRIMGHVYAPEASAATWNNHLSRGMSGNPLYDGMMAPMQSSVQIMLAASGFHGVVISTEAAFSEMALGIQTPGIKAKLLSIPKAIASPIRGAYIGGKVMQEYLQPGTFPQYRKGLDAAIQGGFRVSGAGDLSGSSPFGGGKKTVLGVLDDQFAGGERVAEFNHTFRSVLESENALRGAAKLPKAAIQGVMAGIEKLSHPILGKFVPAQKAYATMILAEREMAKMKPGATLDDIRAVQSKVANQMDFRFGQVIYDNYFIHNAAKHVAQFLFLAPGWTFGTISLAADGIAGAGQMANTLRKGKVPEVPHGVAYWTAGIIGTGIMNMALTYALTGDDPSDMTYKDLLAFRDGTTDQDGNPNRHVVPGYLMHDIYGWSHHPVKTFTNKLSPGLHWAYSVLKNSDHWGNKVYDPNAPIGQVSEEIAAFTAENLGTPITFRNMRESKRRDDVGLTSTILNLSGVGPAPRDFQRTKAQALLASMTETRRPMGATPEKMELARDRGAARAAVRESDTQAVREALEDGTLSMSDVKAEMGRVAKGVPALVTRFKMLSLPDAEKVYAAGTPEEKRMFAPALTTKRINAALKR